MLDFILLTLGAALLLYTLLGGADFGAGILEVFGREARSAKRRKLVAKAIGPVWEANHVWLILAVVIIFMAFPRAYAELSVAFHWPLVLLLVGIVLRGCTFAFGAYDPFHDRSHALYAGVFMLSSIWCSFFLGLTAGAVMLGLGESALNPFCLVMGIFVCALHAFLAAVYLIGESRDPTLKRRLILEAQLANAALLICGGGVFIAGQTTDLRLAAVFFRNPYAITAFVGALALLLPLWKLLRHRNPLWSRLIAAAQGALILVGWFAIQLPYLVRPLTIAETAAPQATLSALTIGLSAGAVVVLPAFFYLLNVFKFHQGTAE